MGAVALVATVIRIAIIPRQGLWADEIFSLAIATGHSLEQPANQSRPELGDYYESPEPRPASFYRTFLQNDRGADFTRVTRAVFLSDTNPPLYYVLLHWWTLSFGTSDSSLRMFSAVWSLATLAMVFLVGRRIGGFRTGIIASLIFAVAPQALFYSTEGRMYSLMWFLITAYA
ncbi:MAG TPA: glycosyltransferase family 39 protein, partial [Candidatus Binataceae bacterium]